MSVPLSVAINTSLQTSLLKIITFEFWRALLWAAPKNQ